MDRKQLQPLADAVIGCDSTSYFEARDTTIVGCVGEIERELESLGYRSALANHDRTRIEFRNGDDGTGAMGSVMSGIAYYAVPGSPQTGDQPLSGPPHQWFYFQHD